MGSDHVLGRVSTGRTIIGLHHHARSFLQRCVAKSYHHILTSTSLAIYFYTVPVFAEFITIFSRTFSSTKHFARSTSSSTTPSYGDVSSDKFERMAGVGPNRYLARRPLVLGLSKVLALTLGQLPLVQGAPFHASTILFSNEQDTPKDAEDPDLWLYLTVAAVLVLLGGAFAGLTIALMGQVRGDT
jgi:hypothetical protein